ncbi:hypothetical protein A2933_00730 [Candidatus Nomurabacteria bacterium RIFCSPLOWO2_01_FULL_46_18]|uniref:Uncharacterized protein n=1 Tax=Candidatus Nomurabacteria bacterium RIFCSPLOWO2_01_FULL_46_18 TaxID=1801783 RepID=A0A1F6XEQ2_9BACT|nr:MAG: hypothetical protein A2933_00730 [Candidatus Nomurabacteria bacterium RIFCSPLOWO2_01_FULL_46_18]
MLKNKRVILVALAVVFLVSIFFIKTKSQWTNEETASAGLVSGNEILSDILSRDTDKDGILDWEEGLWGTDPTKRDTNDDGVSDREEIAKLKAERMANAESGEEISYTDDENLTQTDKFARELFSTVVALNQAGEIDDNTVQQITDSLTLQIQNPVQRKVFTMTDLKVTNDNSLATYKKYSDDTDIIFQNKYPFDEEVANTLQKFISEGEDPDANILIELDPVIKNLGEMVEGMTKINVPSSIATLHLDITNALQRVMENLSDIRAFDSDPITTIGAINQYVENLDALDVSIINELKEIENKFQ